MQEQTTKHEQKVNGNMTIGEIISHYPSLVEVLMKHGIHCIGCGASTWERLEDGLKGHGYSDDKIAEVVKELNEAIPAEGGIPDVFIVTEKASEKLEEILKKQNKQGYGLRVGVISGGCSGSQYSLGFENKAQENDIILETQHGTKIYIDQESMLKVRGAKMDYVETLQGAGFKISNPNAKGSCACGSSFK